jgi:hypothetical protein
LYQAALLRSIKQAKACNSYLRKKNGELHNKQYVLKKMEVKKLRGTYELSKDLRLPLVTAAVHSH